MYELVQFNKEKENTGNLRKNCYIYQKMFVCFFIQGSTLLGPVVQTESRLVVVFISP